MVILILKDKLICIIKILHVKHIVNTKYICICFLFKNYPCEFNRNSKKKKRNTLT